MQPTAVWRIPVGGKDSRGLSWHGDDLPDGATIISATKAVTPLTGLTVGDPVVNAAADGVSISLTTATAGLYIVTITATRSDGGLLVEYIYIEVGTVAISASALVALDDVRNFLGWQPGQNAEGDTRLIAIIESVSAAMAGSVDCLFVPEEEIEETKDGNGMSYLHLDNWPVTDVDSVVEDGVTLNEDSDFYVDYANGILEKPRGYKWTTSKRGVVVTYDAGYEAVPADVKLAAIVESARAYSALDKQMFGESSRTQEGEAISINTDELLPATLATLARYRRVRI